MSILFNPVFVSVTVLCTLCLCRLHVLISLVLAALIGAAVGGIPLSQAMEILCGGFGTNAGTALSYIFLGAFASGVASTGLADWMSRIFAKNLGGCRGWICLALAGTASLSQNLIPVHIAFIPIMIPPLLTLFDRMKLDRRSAACSLAFGLKAPYICIPFGFGFIFIKIVADNMTASGMPVSVMDVTKCNWLLGLAMFVGLLFAILVTYRKPREYPNSVSRCTGSPECTGSSFFPECTESVGEGGSQETSGRNRVRDYLVTFAALAAVVAVQVFTRSLALSALCGLLLMIFGGVIRWKELDGQLAEGVKLMGMIAIIMLVAGGYAEVMKATGSVDQLVRSAAELMGGNRWIAAFCITFIGLLVTMGIGSSFSTVPVLAMLYVPLCSEMGFSVPATILLMSAAAALGDAGSPASDTTLGPTSGLNADGAHDHIRDTCVPTFLHFNIPLMIVSIVGAQFI
ncbi:MAG: hypothetical protein J6J31_10340 [Thermoguttaceae bacterium]|nr:hypothetical protein [Thermoguttaceae bacterium]